MRQNICAFPKKQCSLCGARSALVSRALGLCSACITGDPEAAAAFVGKAHRESKVAFGLPAAIPRDPRGARCNLCVNECSIEDGQRGFCGLRSAKEGRLVHLAGSARGGIGQWYYDPLPTNCVASWVCPAETGAGYPRYAYRPGPERGYKNLAVFLGACSFDCLFCQNWHYRSITRQLSPTMAVEELLAAADEATACVCFFGGDPTPQLPFALAASAALKKAKGNRILRICWETNACMHPRLLLRMAEHSLLSGGCVKVDLKAYNEDLHIALTGVTNSRTLENFQRLAEYIPQRPDPPFLLASTLLVPGYVGEEEVTQIAAFIASLDPTIPYSLLAFYPAYFMGDLPTTSWKQAQECLRAARAAGLERAHLGNLHLLS